MSKIVSLVHIRKEYGESVSSGLASKDKDANLIRESFSMEGAA